MRTLNAKTRVPTAVSLMLIFAYSMLMVMIPPTQSGAYPMHTEQPALPANHAQAELLLRAGAAEPAQGEAERSLQ